MLSFKLFLMWTVLKHVLLHLHSHTHQHLKLFTVRINTPDWAADFLKQTSLFGFLLAIAKPSNQETPPQSPSVPPHPLHSQPHPLTTALNESSWTLTSQRPPNPPIILSLLFTALSLSLSPSHSFSYSEPLNSKKRQRLWVCTVVIFDTLWLALRKKDCKYTRKLHVKHIHVPMRTHV